VSRGTSRPSLTVAADEAAVRLQAEVPDVTPEALYALSIEDATGRRLFDESALAVHTAGPYRFVEAVVPATVLAPGDRTVSLKRSGAASDAPATFRWKLTGLVDSPPKK
jgi:hypothetical protein